jgi:hypothetical protein
MNIACNARNGNNTEITACNGMLLARNSMQLHAFHAEFIITCILTQGHMLTLCITCSMITYSILCCINPLPAYLTGVGSSLVQSLVCLSLPPPQKKNTGRDCSLWNADDYFKWGPDQIRDQNTIPSPTMPRSQGLIQRLQQYSAKYKGYNDKN